MSLDPSKPLSLNNESLERLRSAASTLARGARFFHLPPEPCSPMRHGLLLARRSSQPVLFDQDKPIAHLAAERAADAEVGTPRQKRV